MIEVGIKGKIYKFGFHSLWGPMYAYELMAQKSGLPAFDGRLHLCLHALYYCILTQANDDFPLTLDEFILSLSDTKLVAALDEEYIRQMRAFEDFNANETEETEDSKKKE